MAYVQNILIGLDQTLNAVLRGSPDETVSSRAWRLGGHPSRPPPLKRRWVIARRVIDALFFWQRGHCQAAYEAERKRKQMPRDLRDTTQEPTP